MKAKFRMSAVVDRSFLCVSNMPTQHIFALPQSKKLVVFETTPQMSTYVSYTHLCFITLQGELA
jgi:aminopeptidase N